MIYTPENWFWRLPDGRIWSSAAKAYVAEQSEAYAAHMARNGFVPPAESEAQIRDALAAVGLRHLGPGYVPEVVEMWQAKAALRAVDLYDAADAAITASGNIALQSIWIDGNTVRRDSPAIAAIGQALGLTSEGIDLLFVAAAQMQV